MTVLPSDSARWALLRAIQIEIHNGALYDSLAEVLEGYENSVTQVFREMADEERKHSTELKAHFRAKFGPVPLLTREPKEVIEAAELYDAEAIIFDSMTPEQALQTGLRAEEDARDFYCKEVLRTSDPELQQAYRELAEFEEGHVRVLQEKLREKRRVASSASR